MRILLTNDDGARAPGLFALAQELMRKNTLTIVAPAEEQSGVSHAFTFLQPIMSRRIEFELGISGIKAYAVTGTPVDCVKLGCYHLGEALPDVIVSGINRGANLGTDVLYSGTASAAMEGAMLGIPSIAVSCNGDNPTHYKSAARYAQIVLDYIAQYPIPPHMMLNLNVPDKPFDEIKGLMPAKLAVRVYDNQYERRKDPRGRYYFWLSDAIHPDYEADTDESWEQKSYATLTPICVDITQYAYLEQMRGQDYFADVRTLRERDTDSRLEYGRIVFF